MKNFNLIIILGINILFSCCNNLNNSTAVNPISTTKDAVAKFVQKDYFTDSGRITVSFDTAVLLSKLKYDSAIAFLYGGVDTANLENTFDVIDDSGRWAKTIIKRKIMTKSEAKEITQIIYSKSTYKDKLESGCFEPGIGIVYFNKTKAVGRCTICLSCFALELTAHIQNDEGNYSFGEYGKEKMKNFFYKIGLIDNR